MSKTVKYLNQSGACALVQYGQAKISLCKWIHNGGSYTINLNLKEDNRFFFQDKLLYLAKYETIELPDDREEYKETFPVSNSLELGIQPTTGGFVVPDFEYHGYISFCGSTLDLKQVLEEAEKIEEFFKDFIL